MVYPVLVSDKKLRNVWIYDSHLIMQEIDKFDVTTGVIPNGLEKCMAFTINTNLVFIDKIQFINSNLDALVTNLSDNDFKFWSQELISNLLELIKQKGAYPHEYIDSFKRFFDDKPADESFSSLKDECINEKDYLHAIDVCIMLKRKTMSDYHDLYLKTEVLLLTDVSVKFIPMWLKYYGLDPWIRPLF